MLFPESATNTKIYLSAVMHEGNVQVLPGTLSQLCLQAGRPGHLEGEPRTSML